MARQKRRYTVLGLTATTSLLAVGLSPVLLSGSAQAVTTPATVSFSGQHLNYSVTIQADADRCTYPTSSDQTLVVCTWIVEAGQDPASIATFTLGDKNDTVTFVNPSQDTYSTDEFSLGTGNDTYTSTKYLDGSRILGDAGKDKLYGGQGKDTLSGGPGRDIIKQS